MNTKLSDNSSHFNVFNKVINRYINRKYYLLYNIIIFDTNILNHQSESNNSLLLIITMSIFYSSMLCSHFFFILSLTIFLVI